MTLAAARPAPTRHPVPRSAARAVSQPHDADERQAERAADEVSRGGTLSGWSFAAVPRLAPEVLHREEGAAPAKPQSDEEKKKEAVTKTAEAVLETPTGKALKEKVLADPVVKGVTDFVSTPGGLALAGAAVAGGVAGLAAGGKELPFQPPAIPLDRITPGLSAQLTYAGPVNAPTDVGLTLTFKEQAPKGKGPKKKTAAERQREENARLAAELAAFRGSLRYAPGSKEAEEERLEQEALARAIAQRSGLPGLFVPLAPVPAKKKTEKAAPVQRLPMAGPAHDPGAASDGGAVDQAVATPGRRLDAPTRHFMEARFGYDFSAVRVHDDARAAAAANRVGATAFTVGTDVVFGAGRYDPSTPHGRRLLAHELAHVVQQSEDHPREDDGGRRVP